MAHLSNEEQAQLRDEIRAAGLRATAPRVAVLALLRGYEGPISHGEVVDQLERQGWDRATLYRNLIDLTRVDLARRTDVGDHVWRFEARREHDDAGAKHPHFLCTTCGTVACIPGVEVRIPRGNTMNQSLQRGQVEVQLKGICDNCD